MWGPLVQFAVNLALAVLKVWLERNDLTQRERQRQTIEALGLERAALEWTALALRDPARASALRVQFPDLSLGGFVPDAPADAPRGAPTGHL